MSTPKVPELTITTPGQVFPRFQAYDASAPSAPDKTETSENHADEQEYHCQLMNEGISNLIRQVSKSQYNLCDDYRQISESKQSFKNSHNTNIENIPKLCKDIHSSLGFFESKDSRRVAFVKMVISLNNKQRQNVRAYYSKHYKSDLLRVISKRFSGIFRDLLLYCMMTPSQLNSMWIYKATKKNDLKTVISLLCAQSNGSLKEIEKNYDSQYPMHLKAKIHSMTVKASFFGIKTKNVQKVLFNLLNGQRPNDEVNVNWKKIEKDVGLLLDLLDKIKKQKKQKDIEQSGCNLLIYLFTKRSFKHLYYICVRFNEITQKKIINLIDDLFAKNHKDTAYALKVILLYSTQRCTFFGSLLSKSIQVANQHKNYNLLLRVIVDRCEIDLKDIIDDYGKKALKDWIQMNIEKHSKELILRLCGL